MEKLKLSVIPQSVRFTWKCDRKLITVLSLWTSFMDCRQKLTVGGGDRQGSSHTHMFIIPPLVISLIPILPDNDHDILPIVTW